MNLGDFLTLIVSTAAVLIVAGLGFWNTRWAARESGANSDQALARTIEADREGRLLERRYDLYADLLAHVGERKQNRDVIITSIKVTGWTPLDPYEPAEIFRLYARAQAIADPAVLAAFRRSNEAAEQVIRDWNYLQIAKDDPAYYARHLRMFERRGEADLADEALQDAIRSSLHREPLPMAQHKDGDSQDGPSAPEEDAVVSDERDTR